MPLNTAGIRGSQNTLLSPGTETINYRSNRAHGKQDCSGAWKHCVGKNRNVELFTWNSLGVIEEFGGKYIWESLLFLVKVLVFNVNIIKWLEFEIYKYIAPLQSLVKLGCLDLPWFMGNFNGNWMCLPESSACSSPLSRLHWNISAHLDVLLFQFHCVLSKFSVILIVFVLEDFPAFPRRKTVWANTDHITHIPQCIICGL